MMFLFYMAFTHSITFPWIQLFLKILTWVIINLFEVCVFVLMKVILTL